MSKSSLLSVVSLVFENSHVFPPLARKQKRENRGNVGGARHFMPRDQVQGNERNLQGKVSPGDLLNYIFKVEQLVPESLQVSIRFGHEMPCVPSCGPSRPLRDVSGFHGRSPAD